MTIATRVQPQFDTKPIPGMFERCKKQDVISTVTYCATHPTVETYMRCKNPGCNKRICLKCSVHTDVGYRCLTCERRYQEIYFTAKFYDNLIIFTTCFLIAMIAIPLYGLFFDIFGFIGFWIAIIAGPGSGMILVQIVRYLTQKRTSRYAARLALYGIVVGALFGIGTAALAVDALLWTSLPMYVWGFTAGAAAYRLLK